MRLVITEVALLRSYRYLGWSPELVASEREKGAFTNPVKSREIHYPGVPTKPIPGDAIRSVASLLQQGFNTKVYSYFVIHSQELQRVLDQFAREELPYGPTSPWASCPRMYWALRELFSVLYGTPPPVNRTTVLSMDLTLENQHKQLMRAGGGRFAHLAGQVGNVPRSCGTNAQTILDLVMRRNEVWREKKKRNRRSRIQRLKEREGDRYVDRTILRRGIKLGMSRDEIINLRGPARGGVQQPKVKPAPARISLQEYRRLKQSRSAPSATITSAQAEQEDLRVQLNRDREQLGFAQPLGGSYTRKDRFFYKVPAAEVVPEQVPEVVEVRTINRVVPMDVSDAEVLPLDQVGDWLDEYEGKWESD